MQLERGSSQVEQQCCYPLQYSACKGEIYVMHILIMLNYAEWCTESWQFYSTWGIHNTTLK